ncbi:ATP-dependent exoDNAse (Exonuclease V) alpha subunit-helicase superfamily I member-like protein [uncultured Mycobacterium sp.]|uniref:ATP-dependent exoDNAse (Exonuclease V) alpha subunit-helicase superfamily I member-like protein n=1 Tax=uncultured Mycobacterium sp. TaxID=171292 RepID=A0A1Y5PNK4_9MYCO|nr:ATP-dependent exoDNAse (Exonuclease V) alpha subunit-helicase superfamily I member-like protein [uncultured Mycobacterium sp.]
MLTISRLSRWSIAYYEKTANEAKQSAMDRQAANGGLGEYYSEGDTRVPTWMVAGDAARVAELTGLSESAVAGGFAEGDDATVWLDDGIAPNGASGRAFTKESVHGFDLTFAAPKSVSLVRALTNDIAEKAVSEAHTRAVAAALDYLHQHAGYTRVHNPLTGKKDLQRLPGLATIAYQHETSRCGDPHLHTHVILPNRQAREDGALVSIDSKSLHHEAKAAGIVYQAVLRHELHVERRFEWEAVGEHSGMAELAGITKKCIKAWSQRSTRLREWARDNLTVIDGAPTAAQLQMAQKATRPAKPESLAWDALKETWRADARGLETDHAALAEARRARAAAPPLVLDYARLTRMAANIDKAAFTRADLVELIGAQLPVGERDPRHLIEAIANRIAVRVTAPREGHHREGHELFTVDAVIAEEERVFEMIDEQDTRTRLDVRTEDLGDLSADQARAIRNIAHSPYLVQPLQAPAGAGKTHSLKVLRAAAHRAGKEVLVLAPTGKAVDEAMRDEAGDRGLTVDKALKLIAADQLQIDRRTVIIVDEASMVGTPDLKKLLACATVGRAKMVLVGDAYQLAPVKKRGGMFEHLSDDLPWSQRLGEVWRMRSAEERDVSLALRSGHGNRLRKAVGWYRNQGRLHTGDPIAMADDATNAYIDARAAGKDAAIICDRWEIADAINRKLHGHYTQAAAAAAARDGAAPAARAATVRVARDQDVCAGDIIISRNNDATIEVTRGPQHQRGDRVDQVRNGNRWRVAAVDPASGQLLAERLTDSARVVFEGEYLREHVTLGYATTLHAAQGITVGSSTREGACFTVLSDQASRAMAYVGMTRGKDENHAFIYQPITGESDHEHSRLAAGDQIHTLRRGNKHAAAHYFRMILANDDRPRTMHAEAERTDRDQLPEVVATLLDRNDQRRATRASTWRQHNAAARSRAAAFERITATSRGDDRAAEQSRSADVDGLEL